MDRDVVISSYTPGYVRDPVPSRPPSPVCKPCCMGNLAASFVECLAENYGDVVESSVAFWEGKV